MGDDDFSAQDRTIKRWFDRIEDGSLKLPRFQRHEAWDRSTVVDLMETVLRGLPAGAALILNVGDEEPFISRRLVTAPEGDGRVTEHLLDGQQRLTALWRSLNGTYDDLALFVKWIDDEDHAGAKTVRIESQPRWWRKINGTRVGYPRWVDSPEETFERGLVPVTLIAPGAHDRVVPWLKEALNEDLVAVMDWQTEIGKLRERVATYNIPYLSLPASTPRDVALDVFIKMNTSNFKLTAFDIVVAQVEAAAGQSMHDLVSEIATEVPGILRYGDLGDLLLDVSCLLSGRPSSKANYLRLDHEKLPNLWRELVEPLKFVVDILESERVYDDQRLPSVAVRPVLVALAADLPKIGDELGRARTLLSYYLWRAFLTRRYEAAAASRAYRDYTALRDAIANDLPFDEVKAPIFDETEYPVPGVEQLLTARWPKSRDTLARGVLALTLREGGIDIADGAPATRDSVTQREYHHLFPDSMLESLGGIEESGDRFRALNCALVTWHTNRRISNKDPIAYLKDRVDRAALGENEVRARLQSHLVPWKEISQAGPYEEGADTAAQVQADYDAFLNARAALVAEKAAQRSGRGHIGPRAGEVESG